MLTMLGNTFFIKCLKPLLHISFVSFCFLSLKLWHDMSCPLYSQSLDPQKVLMPSSQACVYSTLWSADWLIHHCSSAKKINYHNSSLLFKSQSFFGMKNTTHASWILQQICCCRCLIQGLPYVRLFVRLLVIYKHSHEY